MLSLLLQEEILQRHRNELNEEHFAQVCKVDLLLFDKPLGHPLEVLGVYLPLETYHL